MWHHYSHHHALELELDFAACPGSIGGDMNAWESYWCLQCNCCCLCHEVAVALAIDGHKDLQTHTGGHLGQGVLISSQHPAFQSCLLHFELSCCALQASYRQMADRRHTVAPPPHQPEMPLPSANSPLGPHLDPLPNPALHQLHPLFPSGPRERHTDPTEHWTPSSTLAPAS